MCVQILCLKNCINVSIFPKLNQIVHPIPYISNIFYLCAIHSMKIFSIQVYICASMCNSFNENAFNTQLINILFIF
jgi:hypothetical protein